MRRNLPVNGILRREIIVRVARSLVALAALALALVDVPWPGAAVAQGLPTPGPDPNYSTCPAVIALVGLDAASVPAASARFTVTIRNGFNQPMPGVDVSIGLLNGWDVAFCASQPDPSVTVDCAADLVSKLTDENGQASFTLTGRGTGTFSFGASGCLARVLAGEQLIHQVLVTTFDLDGSGDAGGGDLSALVGQFVLANGSLACDYDNNGSIGGGDLSLWLGAFSSGTQVQSGGAICP